MSFNVSCPHCKQSLQLPPITTASQVRCPHCKGSFVVSPPRPAPVAVGAAAPATPQPPRPRPTPGAICPNCRSPLAAGARACLECGHLITPTAAPARPAAPAATPEPVPAPAVPSASPMDFRQWPPALRLLPAGLLALVLLAFVVRDRFLTSAPAEDSGDEAETVVEVPIDPDPLLDVKFQEPDTQRFGLTMRNEKDAKGKPKRLTFAADGDTNNALVQIDGENRLFGKFVIVTGGSGVKGERGGQIDANRQPRLLRGRWLQSQVPLGQDRNGRERLGRKGVYLYEEQKVQITQSVEIVADEQVAPGQTKRRLDTCLVRYLIENQDDRPHRIAFRFLLDTFIGGNDGVPFTIPGASGLCTDDKDFATSSSIPDFIQALEKPSLEAPGTIAHLTLRPGGRLDPPDRVTLGHWKDLSWPANEEPHVDWQFPVAAMAGDSCVVLYWNAKELPPGGRRELGFAYGLGHVSSAEGGGKLALTLGGSFRPQEDFTITAYVNEPLRGQTVTLELPRGLTRSEGDETQAVPPVPADSASRNSPVTWKVKAARAGRYTLKVKSSTGVTQTQKVTITSSGGIFD